MKPEWAIVGVLLSVHLPIAHGLSVSVPRRGFFIFDSALRVTEASLLGMNGLRMLG